MSDYEYEQELIRRYQAEVLGEAYFSQVMSYFDEPDKKYKWAVMLQLETETKARVRSLMMNLGMDVAESEESRRTGISMAEEMRGKNWLDAISAFRDLALALLEDEKGIAAKAPPEYRTYAESMISHGQCFFDFAELELSGKSQISLSPIVELLEHKVPLVSPV